MELFATLSAALAQPLQSLLALSWLDSKQLILIAAAPLFLLAVALEWRALRRRGQAQSYTMSRTFTNLNLGLAYQAFEAVVHALLFMAMMQWVYQHRLLDVPFNGWTLLPLFVLQEFCYYWFHRASHRIRWFWCAHVVHHSDQAMNLTTAMRQSMLYALTGYWLFFAPLMLIGLTPHQAMALYAANLFYQFFVHTELVRKLPRWLEYVFVTPSHHRAHHGRNPRYIDRNYGGVLIIFDRLFGTLVQEDEPVDYGIPQQIDNRNIWTLNTHEFASMLRDMRQPGPLWQRLQHLWWPPEWVRPAP